MSAAVISSPSSVSDRGAVSWGAVFAGAVGAMVLSLVLFVLGTGLGLAVISPWTGEGISGTAISVSTIVWITIVQIAASVLGGYLAGRLRSRWLTVHTNEVYFRDTAHGFLAWAVGTLLMATLLSSAVGSIVTTGVKATGAVAGSAVAMAGSAAAAGAASMNADDANTGSLGYAVDSLFRAPPAATQPDSTAAPGASSDQSPANKTAEVTRIFANGLESGELNNADTQYLGQLVAANTGLSQADAEKRVTDTFSQLHLKLEAASAKAKQVADDARKASAYTALWLVISLLTGAFAASFSATFGGRLRDSSALAT